MSWERLAVYTLACDVKPCVGAVGVAKSEPYSEDMLPYAGEGLRGAEKEARHHGWTVKRTPGKGPLYACPACTREGKAASLGQ